MHNGDEIEKQERDETFSQQHNLPCQITSGVTSCHGPPTVKPARAEVRDSRVKSVLACSDASPRKTRMTYASNTSCQLLHGHTTTYTIYGWVGPSFIMSLPRNVLLTMCAVSVNHKVNKWTNKRTIQNNIYTTSFVPL